MRRARSLILLTMTAGAALFAQDAAPPTVDLDNTPAPTASPTPDVPELSTLDEVYKQSSLGKAADEAKVRLEMRRLQNEYALNPQVIEAKQAADRASTDSEKRQRLRIYYRVLYGKMRAASGNEALRRGIDAALLDRLRAIAQPHVKPLPDDPSPTPTPKGTPNPKKEKHKHKFGA